MERKVRKERVMINTKKLKAKMVEVGFSQRKLAKECKISLNVLNETINNKRDPRLGDIDILCEKLNISSIVEKVEIFLS